MHCLYNSFIHFLYLKSNSQHSLKRVIDEKCLYLQSMIGYTTACWFGVKKRHTQNFDYFPFFFIIFFFSVKMSEMKSLPTCLNSYSNAKTVLIDNKKESSVINESSDGTIYYSLDSQHSVNLKRPIRDDEGQHAPLSRKASRLYESSESAPQSNKSSPKSDTSQPTDVLPPFVPTPPDWEKHPTAWAYLQALSPNYENKYLVKKSSETERKGYLLGRRADCDIVYVSFCCCY